MRCRKYVSVCLISALFVAGNPFQICQGEEFAVQERILSLTQNLQTDPVTGTASMSIPINVPPGRNGIQPNIAVLYNSGSGNGLLGSGWSMDLGSMVRYNKKGVPRYDSAERFALVQAGSRQEIKDISGGSLSVFRAIYEGTYMQYKFPGQERWEVTDKAGITYYFGTTQDARVYDPSQPSKVFKWALDKVSDVNGNTMSISYERDGNEVYPSTIEYTGRDQGEPPFARVEFHYETRPDKRKYYNAGFLIVRQLRLSSIDIFVDQDGVDVLQRRYAFSYNQEAETGVSLLSSVRQFGDDGQTAMPAMTFEYSSGDTAFDPADATSEHPDVNINSGMVRFFDINGDGLSDMVRTYPQSGWDYDIYLNTTRDGDVEFAPLFAAAYHPSLGFNDVNVRLADFNGDGLLDIIHGPQKPYKVWLNNGQDGFSPPVESYNVPNMWLSNHNLIQLVDMNRDGMADILETYGGENQSYRIYFSRGDGTFDPPIFAANSPVRGTDNPDLQFGDFNGDGLLDAIYGPSCPYTIWINNGVNGYEDPRPVSHCPPHSITHLGTLRFVDLNGDGLTDLLESYTGNNQDYTVYYNNGNVDFNEPVTVAHSPIRGFDNSNVKLIDINGDNLQDVVIGQLSQGIPYQVWLNNGFDGFFPSRFLEHNPNVDLDDNNNVFVDINGDGLTDLLRGATAGGGGYRAHRNRRGPDSSRAGILTRTDNSLGAQVHIAYGNRPIRGLMPSGYKTAYSPVLFNTVEQVTRQWGDDDIYTTAYFLRDGLWDHSEREFRGFGTVKVQDPEGNYMLSEYHQDDARKGRVKKEAVYGAQDTLLKETFYEWLSEKYSWGFTFVWLEEKNMIDYDGSGNAGRVKEVYEYETPNYGNLTKVVQYGEVDPLSGEDIPGDGRVLEYSYHDKNYGSSDYMFGVPRETVVREMDGEVRARTRFYYDGADSIDVLPGKGRLTKKEIWNGDGNPALVSHYSYDEWGGLVSTTDAMNNTSGVAYDNDYHIFPIETVNAEGHRIVEEYYGIDGVALSGGGYHGLWGQKKSTTDPNDVKGRRSYDAFGRLTATVSPLDSVSLPTLSREYVFAADHVRVKTRRRVVSGGEETLDTVDFYDGLGRLIESKSQTAVAGQYLLSGQKDYNTRGLIVKEYLPVFSHEPLDELVPADPGRPGTLLTYDARGRIIRKTSPDGTYSTIEYGVWKTAAIDENGHKQDSVFDAFGRLLAKREYTGADGRCDYYPYEPYQEYAVTSYHYDIAGNLVRVEDALGNVTAMEYDALGRKITMDDPDMKTWQYAYDLNGNLLNQIDAKGQYADFFYDPVNRLVNKSSGTQSVVDYTYDNAGFAYSKGRLTRSSYGPDDRTEFRYDLFGRENRADKTIDGRVFSVERNYNILNNLTDLTLPDGQKVYYRYNAAGQIEAVANDESLLGPGSSTAPLQRWWRKIEHKAGPEKAFSWREIAADIMRWADVLLGVKEVCAETVEVTLEPSADAMLRGEYKDTNFNGSGLRLRGITTNYSWMTLLKFDLSSIPAGSTIDEITLRFTLAGRQVWNEQNYVYECLRDWREDEVTFNEWKAGSAWSVNGARGDGTDMDGDYTGHSGGYVAYIDQWTAYAGEQVAYTSLDAFKTLAQSRAGGTLNLVIHQEYYDNSDVQYYDRENADAGLRPKLTVTYSTSGGGDTNPPTVPGNLTAEASSSSRIDISWDASSDDTGVDGYAVYSDTSGTLIDTVPGTQITYSHTGLQPETAYTYYVKAFDAAGNYSGYSNEAGAATQAVSPTEPFSITLEAEDMPTKTTGGATSGGWNIWSNGYIEEGVDFPAGGTYEFEIVARGSFAGGAWPNMELRIDQQVQGNFTVNTSAWNSYTTQIEVPAGIGYVAVAFTNDYYDPPDDRNLYADKVIIREVEAGDPDTQAPTVPGNLTAEASSSSRIDISWDASSDDTGVDGYAVYSDTSGTLIDTVPGTQTTCSHTGLQPETAYTYYVKAFDAAGNYSGYSNEAGAATPAAPPDPVVLSQAEWTLVYVDSEETYQDSGLAHKAFDGNASTMWHTEWYDTEPVHPHEIQIDLGANYEVTGFRYLPRQDDNLNGAIEDYEFHVSADGMEWGGPAAEGVFPSDHQEKEVTLGVPVTGRYIRLKALSEVNGHAWTSAAEINVLGRIPVDPAPEPPVLNSAGAGYKSVTLNWSAVDGVSGYHVKYGMSPGEYGTVLDGIGDVTSYQVKDLINGVEYYFVVAACDGEAESDNSNELSATPRAAFAEDPVRYAHDIRYNAAGQVVHIEYGNGVVTDYTYDALNLRLKNVKTVNPATQETIQDMDYAYDAAGNIVRVGDNVDGSYREFDYDHLNRLVEARSPSTYGTLSYGYDEIGNLIRKGDDTFTYGEADGARPHAVTSGNGGAMTFQYDDNGNMTVMNRDGSQWEYIYDEENRLKEVKKDALTRAAFEYDGDGGRTKKTTYDYTAGLGSQFFEGTPVLMADGSLKAIERVRPGDWVASFDEDAGSRTFARVSRAVSSLTKTGEVFVVNDGLAAAANTLVYSGGEWQLVEHLGPRDRLVDDRLAETACRRKTVPVEGELLKVYNLELEGRETFFAGGVLVRNALNPLRDRPCLAFGSAGRGLFDISGIVDYTLQAVDSLFGVKKAEAGGGAANTTYFVGSLYEEDDTSLTRHVFAGGVRVASVSNGRVRYYHTDHLGGTNKTTDEYGAVLQTVTYRPYGEIDQKLDAFDPGDQAWHLFTGQRYDDETGLYYYEARYYDPALGRFITADGIVQAPHNPQTFNRYSYAGNNPVNFVDPNGHWFWAALIVGAILGGTSAAVNDQPVWQGVLMGAAGGLMVGGGAAAFGFWGAVGGGMLAGAGSAGIAGGNVGFGALVGGLGAGLGYGLGSWAGGWSEGSFWGGLGAAAIAGGVAGGVGSELAGGEFGEGAWMGAAFSTGGFFGAKAVNSLDPRIRNAERYEQESKKLHDLNVKKNDMVKKDVTSRGVIGPAGHETIDGIEMGPNDSGFIRTSNTVEDIMEWNTHEHTQNAIKSGAFRTARADVSSSGLVEAVALYEQYWVNTNTQYSPASYNSNYAVNTIIYSAGGSVPGGLGWNPPFGNVPASIYHAYREN